MFKYLTSKLLGKKGEAFQSEPIAYDRILAQWDSCYEQTFFPHLETDAHWAYAKVRLSAFRLVNEWLVIFELLIYRIGSLEFEEIIYAYGNRLREVGNQIIKTSSNTQDLIDRLKKTGLKTPNPGSLNDWCPDPLAFEIILNNTRQTFEFSVDDYLQAGIDLELPISSDRCLDQIINVLRNLSHHLSPEQIFLPDELLLEYVNRPPDLPLFVRLYEWCHPGRGTSISKPSESPCLRSLARALTDNEPGVYKCESDLVNTHWSYWPQFGKKR